MNYLDQSIDRLPRTSSITKKRLRSIEINTLNDLLNYVPSRYADLHIVSPIVQLQEGETVTVKGRILEMKNVYTRNRMTIQKMTLNDGTGTIDVTWYNQPYLVRNFSPESLVSVGGVVKRFLHSFSLIPQEYEILQSLDQPTIHTGRLVPIYPEKKHISSRIFRDKIHLILKEIKNSPEPILPDWLPDKLKQFNQLIPLIEAYEGIHFPSSHDEAERARQRLGFDELFVIQLSSILIRREWEKERTGHVFDIASHQEKLQAFMEGLPFMLTNAQIRSVNELLADLAKSQSMNRFVQGDVGSGKTVVATIAAYIAYLNGFQTLIMAPTEILAQQHYNTVIKLLKNTPMKVGIQTGTAKIAKKKGESIKDFDMIVGTQALVTESLAFDKVGLVVIDEQHRFGVRQRALLKQKGINPHLLTMTATPIPRTVALTLYGELDLSVIDELPQGRLPIKTFVVPSTKREASQEWIKGQIKQHKTQVFIICPLIEESDEETLKSVKAATKEYEHLKNEVFKDFKVGLLHGKLKPKEKNIIMEDFKNGLYDILVATSVVEVGIDIPNASIMVIEGAHRYGLAQLHQLRGRVGRGSAQSYCYLFTDAHDSKSRERLQFFASTNSGIKLAEYDLKIRGPGSMYGIQQHGYSDLKVASFSDYPLMHKTKGAVGYFLNHYKLEEHPLLKAKIEAYRIDQISRD